MVVFPQNVVKPKPPAVPPPSEVPEVDLSASFVRASPSPSSSRSFFECLPDRIVLRIFSYLSARPLCRCSAVSRRFRALAWQPQLWRSLALDPATTTDSRLAALLSLVASRAGPAVCVERMAVNGCAALTDLGLRSAAVACGGLRRLELRGCPRVTNAGLDQVFEHCPSLLHLDAAGTREAGPDPRSLFPTSSVQNAHLNGGPGRL